MSAAAPARPRLFVALDLPSAARAELARFRDAAADRALWRPLRDSTFHVTLAFLGDRDAADVERVTAVLGALDPFAAPAPALGAALLLPPRRPRVLAVALADPAGALAALQAAVAGALAAGGLYEPEARPFRPHVTVARALPGVRPPRTIAAAPEPLAFTAGPVTLYRSRLGRGGAAYEPLFARSG